MENTPPEGPKVPRSVLLARMRKQIANGTVGAPLADPTELLANLQRLQDRGIIGIRVGKTRNDVPISEETISVTRRLATRPFPSSTLIKPSGSQPE